MRFSDGFWYIPPESQRRGHPTPFPEELIYRLIRFYTYKDNIVLDMFGGTGTVAVVALKTGRHFIHIDISSRYCEIAEDRLKAARLLKELPLPLGKPGRKIRISRYSASETVKPPLKRKEKQLVQSRLLESRGSYKPKKAKRKTKHA
jgi:hypothetical protein